VVISLDHFKGLYEYLKRRKMVPDFLAHGDMVLAREVIIEIDLLEDNCVGHCDSIYNAIVLSLEGGSHERVAGLFKAAQERPAWKGYFSLFVDGFFNRYPPEKNSMPLKRFLTLHGEEFSKKHPAIFEVVCKKLVWDLKWKPGNPASRKLLIDFVGQSSLLTPVVFAEGLLWDVDDIYRTNFIKYGYKEAIEEGLKEKYGGGGKKLWAVMVSTLPSQFSGEYPSTDEARTFALKNSPTKQDLEEQWILNNTANPQAKLRMQQLAKFLHELGINVVPNVLWFIVAEYLTGPTWLDVE